MRALPDRAGGLLSYFTRHRTAANLLLVMMVNSDQTSFGPSPTTIDKKITASGAEFLEGIRDIFSVLNYCGIARVS